MIPKRLAAELSAVCGADGVITDANRLLAYESDALTAYRHRPGAVVLPRTTEQVQGAVRAVARAGLPIVPRGAGTGLSGGAVALNDAVVIGTARMNRILEVDAENRRAVLQPGVINAELSVAVAPWGLYYAPDPSSQTACTIGGNVAENSGGPHCLKHGVTSRYVTGLKVVLPDGELAELGGLGREGQPFDLLGLFVGSEGCFGIAAEVEVALLPRPEGVRTLLGIFDRIDEAGQAVSDIVRAGMLPAAMEIVDGPTIRAVEDSVFAAGYPTDAEAALVIEFDGLEAGLDREAERAARHCREAGAREVRQARDEAERMGLWKGRKKAFGAMGRIAPDLLVQDATVPRTSLPAVLRGIGRIAEQYDLVVANVFHAGDGNLHPNILFDRRDADELHRVERASKKIMKLCVDVGGTITGEHGVGLDKKHHMTLVCGDEELAAMWGVRRAFDPAGTMNPGKVLPDGTEPEGEAASSPQSAGTRLRNGRVERAAAPTEPSAAADSESRDPEHVLVPESVDEVQAEVRRARRAGSRLPPLSTKRLDAIHHYEPADLTLTAGAGVTLASLEELLAPNGQWLPFDAPGSRTATLGEAAASGASGPLQGRYGAVRDNVLGLEVVTGAGAVLRIGGRVVKNVAGYDLTKLFTGSGGALGVVTRVSVRLFPRPEVDETLIFGGEDGVAMRVARSACTGDAPVAAVEVWEDDSPGSVGGGDAPVAAVRLLGGAEEVAESRRRVVERAGAAPLRSLRGEASARRHLSRTEWEEGAAFVARLTALPAELERAMAVAGALAGEVGGAVTADAVQGVVRVRDRWGEEAGAASESDARAAREALRRAASAMERGGGSLDLSIRRPWAGAAPSRAAPAAAASVVAARIKALFDPDNVLAPL